MGAFIKDGTIMEVSPVCESVFVRQGWKPYVPVENKKTKEETQKEVVEKPKKSPRKKTTAK